MNIDLISRVVQRAAVLDHKLSHRFLLVEVHLGSDHELGVPLRQVSLLHQPLKLEILLAGDHDYLVHVGDHDAGLEEEREVHDDVLVARGGTLSCLPPHLLVDLRVGYPVQLLSLVLVLNTVFIFIQLQIM